MFDQIKAIVDLRKDIPDAIGYDVSGPMRFPLPVELTETLPEDLFKRVSEISLLAVRVDNYSSQALRDVRVLFNGSWIFQPRVTFRRRDVRVQSEIRMDDKEIVIAELPPNESAYIEIFNPVDFSVDQVLISGRAVTGTMQKLAEARRYPELARSMLAMYASVAVCAAALAAVAYVAWKKTSENRIIESAHAGFVSCSPYLFENGPAQDVILTRKFRQAGTLLEPYILAINKVHSLEELRIKDQVILCEPKDPATNARD